MEIIRPQIGYQMNTLSSPADIVIGGGSAGVGKTFSLLLEPLRHMNVKGFGGVVFRRTYPMIKAEGGLWDASQKLYNKIQGARAIESFMEWKISQMKLKFAHMQHEKNKFDWQGSEICFLGFDELTHFSESMFFYLLSRNRSTCGVAPYVRTTCNPDPDSWVANLIEWWIDEEGYPIKDREAKLRYFIKEDNEYIWGDSKDEVYQKSEHILKELAEKGGVNPFDLIKSLTFIGGSIFDNKELLKVDPAYLANLKSQSSEDQLRLLHGNWRVKITTSDIYPIHKFNDITSNLHAPRGERYLTCDIAMKGSDKFVMLAWDGRWIIDFKVIGKCDGKELIDAIKEMQLNNRVPNSNVVFDADGVGSFIDGFIRGARPFNNGSSAMPDPNNLSRNPENYANLKTQCYYRSGISVENANIYVTDEVANRNFDNKMTFIQRLNYERKAIKRAKEDFDGKLKIIDKAQMKVYLNGESPDLMDAFMMREYFDIDNKHNGKYAVY